MQEEIVISTSYRIPPFLKKMEQSGLIIFNVKLLISLLSYLNKGTIDKEKLTYLLKIVKFQL